MQRHVHQTASEGRRGQRLSRQEQRVRPQKQRVSRDCSRPFRRWSPLLGAVIGVVLASSVAGAGTFEVRLRQQTPVGPDGSERYHRVERAEAWDGAKTAVIVCDMWDSHHGYRAAMRTGELAPKVNDLIVEARGRGATIIHAPSDCMKGYADHPGRLRAMAVPGVEKYPEDIAKWCYKIPAEEKAKYPIDQSDGGEDDTPQEHKDWEAELVKQGRNPKAPWLRQHGAIEIDGERDYVSDSGTEIWNILQSRGIEQVILTGVHTNMCVLGRPFGLRRMAQAGKRVVLVRDLTDTMYNPAAWPYVNHFSGNDLIVDHIERHVCPTISSDQVVGGGKPFRFAGDRRPHVAMLINEPEYETHKTLPPYATDPLRKDFRVSLIYGDAKNGDLMPGIELIREADVLLISVRRRTLPADQLAVVRDFVASGKPVIGIRTANHAFHLRGKPAPAGAADWPNLDAEVFGGHYTNHYGNELKTIVEFVEKANSHPILSGIEREAFVAGGSLYQVSPLNPKAEVLLTGSVAGHPAEPIAWTFIRADGGRSFYTSLGAPADFEHPAFRQLLHNALLWGVGAEVDASK